MPKEVRVQAWRDGLTKGPVGEGERVQYCRGRRADAVRAGKVDLDVASWEGMKCGVGWGGRRGEGRGVGVS